MLTKVHTGLDPVPGVWWKPAHKAEKIWVAIAFFETTLFLLMIRNTSRSYSVGVSPITVPDTITDFAKGVAIPSLSLTAL